MIKLAMLFASLLAAVPRPVNCPGAQLQQEVLASEPSEMLPVVNGVAQLELVTEVTDGSVGLLIEQIRMANSIGVQGIHLKINSPGGSVWAGMMLSEAMLDSPAPIACTVDGMAASMAFYILQSCGTREMTRESALMGHEPSAGVMGQLMPKDIEQLRARMIMLNRILAEHIVARMNITIDQYLALTDGKELWLTWDNALKLGAVDTVIPARNAKLRQAHH